MANRPPDKQHTAPAPEAPPTGQPAPVRDDFDPLEPEPRAVPPKDPETGRFLSPSWLEQQARDLGFTDDDITALPPDALARAVTTQLRQQRDYAQTFRQEQARAKVVQEHEVKAPPPEEYDLGLEESRWEPELVQAMKRIGLDSRKRIKELEAKLEAQEKAGQARQQQSAVQLLDAAFAKLGKDYERFFGKGTAAALQNQGEAGAAFMRRRKAAINEAGLDLNTLSPFTLVGQLREAANGLYQAPPANPYAEPTGEAPPGPRITPEQWNGSGLARPTQRQGAAEPKGDAVAVKNLEARMRDAGLMAGDAEILDGIPD